MEQPRMIIQQTGPSFIQQHVAGSVAPVIQQHPGVSPHQQHQSPMMPPSAPFVSHARQPPQPLSQPGFQGHHLSGQPPVGQQLSFSVGLSAQQPLRDFPQGGQFAQSLQRLPVPQQQQFVAISQEPRFIVNQPPNQLHVTNIALPNPVQQNTLPVRVIQPQMAISVVGSQSKFKDPVACSEPEFVGQPIETVVNARHDPHRTGGVRLGRLICYFNTYMWMCMHLTCI
jgi:hypothetical protein